MRSISGVLLLCVTPLGGFGQLADPVAGKDLLGDPLPTAATARFGTYRLWQGATVGAVAISPDGKLVATAEANKSRLLGPKHTLGSSGGEIRIWDASDGRLIRKLAAPSNWNGNSLAFSPDGKRLAVGASNKISIWDVTTGQMVVKLEEDRGIFSGIGFSSDGKYLHATKPVSPGQPGALQVVAHRWDAMSGKLLKSWPDTVRDKATAPLGQLVQISLSVSPDGRTLLKGYWKAPGADGNELRLFDAESGKQMGTIGGLSADPSLPVFSADGKRFAIGQGQSTYVGTLSGEPGLIKIAERADALALTPDGASLVGLRNNQVTVWDAKTGKQARKPATLDHNRFVWSKSPLATDGKIMATGDGESVRLWNFATGTEHLPRSGHNRPVQYVNFARDGRSLFSSDGQAMWRWDLFTGKGDRLTQNEVAARPGGATGRVSSDGRIWIQGGGGLNQNVTLTEVATGKKLGGVTVPDMWSKPDANAATGLVAWMRQDGLIRLTKFNGDTVREFGHSGPTIQTWIWSHLLCFSPDGRQLLTSFAYGQRGQAAFRHYISVWDVATGREIRRLPITRPDTSPAHLACAAFSSDGRMVAVGQYIENLLGGKGEPMVSVWEVLSAQECKKFGSHEGAILTVAFSPDDRRLASGSDDGTILYWRMVHEPAVKDGDLTDDRLQALWKDLAGDASNAVDAVWLLSARPQQVLPLLKANLRPVQSGPQEPIQKLIDDLGRVDFPVRDRATKGLEKLGEKAIPALNRALAKNPLPEVRRRIELLLDKAEAQLHGTSKEALQPLRAIAVLERMRTAEAIALLRTLAEGAEEARLTQEARASLSRIEGKLD